MLGSDYTYNCCTLSCHCFHSDTTQSKPNSKEFWVNMPNLMTHLKKVAEQKPQATYYNVDMLKYQVGSHLTGQWMLNSGTQMNKITFQNFFNSELFLQNNKVCDRIFNINTYCLHCVYQVSAQGIQSTPLNLAMNWRCEPTSTDLRIDYRYNGSAMTTPVALNNVQFLVPVDGGVGQLQAVLPPAAW